MIPHDDAGKALNLVGHTPNVLNKTLTLANTEYSQALPAGTRRFTLQARTSHLVQLCYTNGASGTTFISVKAGSSYSEEHIDSGATLYMQSANAGTVVEIIAWS
jgi:hypothetical protein